MRWYLAVFVAGLVISNVLAQNETLDVQSYLPLFERNSLGRKILDVSYSENTSDYIAGKANSYTQDVHLVFDAGTGKYREEVKVYSKPYLADVYKLNVYVWDGKEFLYLMIPVSRMPGFRSLESGKYEFPGMASIKDQPYGKIPIYLHFMYDAEDMPFAKSIQTMNPIRGYLTGDDVSIEADVNTFTFSKKTGALRRIVNNLPRSRGRIKVHTFEFSNHLDCSGIWIPLRIVETIDAPQDNFRSRRELSVDPKTLRLIDEVDDTIFHETLSAGCGVQDEIRKNNYMVTTLDTTPPQNVEAMKKTLDKMLEQAEEQKAAVEKKK